jgi:tetratricopeptide (TPR) repeat protein
LLLLITCFITKAALAQSVAFADSVFFSNDYIKADSLYNTCLKKHALDSNKIATIYLRKGLCLSALHKTDEAFAAYYTALKKYGESNNELGQAKTNWNLANAYFAANDFINTEKYLTKSEQLFTKLNDSSNLVRVYSTKALLYNETLGSREAIAIRLSTLKNFKNFFDAELESNYYFNLGDDYALFNKDSAIYCYEKTLQIIEDSDDSTLLIDVFVNLGSIYLENQNLKKANFYLQKATPFISTTSDSVLIREYYKYYGVYFYKTGNYKKAYEYADSAKQYNDALFNKDKTTVLAELSEKYEGEKKDITIQQQAVKNKNFTKALLATGIGLAIVALLAAFSYTQYRKKQKANALLEQQNNAIQELNQQLYAANQTKITLFSIISHDLRAPLSSLYALLQTNTIKQSSSASNDTITKQTEQLLDTLENLLLWSKTQLTQFALHPVNTNLPQVFKTVEALYMPTITSQKITVQHVVEGNGTLITDEDVLQVVIRNIYSNALQNAPANSTITFQYQLFKDVHMVECTNSYATNTIHNSTFLSERGLGTTLIKDFCHKINATVHFSAGEAQYTVLLKVPSLVA